MNTYINIRYAIHFLTLFLICGICQVVLAQPGGNNYALFFGVNDYNDPKWPNLDNPIKDATAIAQSLQQDYGFWTRVYRNSSLAEIEAILTAWQERQFGENDQLFIYFSGHGTFREFSQQGFFIPQDGQTGIYGSYLELSSLAGMVSQISCAQILLSIDACYSGTIDQSLLHYTPKAESIQAKDTAEHTSIGPSRLLLTSGGKVRTPEGNRHSPFSGVIIQALRENALSGDGTITYNKLLGKLLKVEPTPHTGELPGHVQGGFSFNALAKDRSSISDAAGNDYPILQMQGGKRWLGKNLNLQIGDSVCYGEAPANCAKYGRLYTWRTAEKACRSLGPSWRLPSELDWKALITLNGQEKFAYTNLLQGGNSQFGAQLGGSYRTREGFLGLEKSGYYWTEKELNVSTSSAKYSNAASFHFGDERKMINKPSRGLNKNYKLSVRCIQD